jgi:hypothetical protein
MNSPKKKGAKRTHPPHHAKFGPPITPIFPGPASIATRPHVPTDVIIISRNSPSGTQPLVLEAMLDGKVVQKTFDAADSAQAWTIVPLVQSQYSFLLHKTSGKYAHFNGPNAQITVLELNPFYAGFLISFEDERGGFTAINNDNHSQVFSVWNGSTADGEKVIGTVFDDTAKQWWMLEAITR